MNKKKKKKKNNNNKSKVIDRSIAEKKKPIEPIQAEDSFALVSHFFSKILTAQQLSNLRKIYNVYEEIESREAE